MSLRTFTDAAADAVAREIASVRREAQRELALLKEQASAIFAQASAKIAEADARVVAIEARVAAIRDGKDGRDGERGMDGAPGRDGLDGAPGRDGKDGADGRDGLDGAPGRDGKDGADGRDGASITVEDVEPLILSKVAEAIERIPPARDGVDGAPGRDGADGINGRDGVDGANGRDGIDGVHGKDGAPGRDGIDGRDGERGPEGPAGKLPLVKAWADEVHYEGEVVSHEGASWQALKNTGRAPGHEDWRLIAAAGRDGTNGADGRSFTVRGTWLATSIYRAMDVVAVNGSSFIAKQDEPGDCPGEGWQLIASKGSRGAPGERGDRGLPGQKGDPGSPVVAMSIDDDGMLTLTNGDGSTVSCDLYPVLARLG